MNAGLSRDRAHALCQRALDGELSRDEERALEAALAADPELERELAGLRSVADAAARLADNAPSVDLLASVQLKLRTRSGGRFYRDRFAETRGRRPGALAWMLGASALVLVVTLLWLLFEAGLLPR